MNPGRSTTNEVGVPKKDLYKVLEDLQQVAVEGELLQEKFNSAVKEFETTGEHIQEIRKFIEDTCGKWYSQYEDHEAASKLVQENVELFGQINELLKSKKELPISAEERNSFERQKRYFEEAVEKYSNEISALESQRAFQLENIKRKYDTDRLRLMKTKQELKDQIETLLVDFESQLSQLKLEHEVALEKLSETFATRLAEIKKSGDHSVCESQLTSLKSGWSEALHRLETSLEKTKNEILELRGRKRRSCRSGRRPSKKVKNCKPDSSQEVHTDILATNFEEVPESSSDPTLSRLARGSQALLGTDQAVLHTCSVGSKERLLKKRLFFEEPIEEPLDVIAEPSQTTIDGYLSSLQKIISACAKK